MKDMIRTTVFLTKAQYECLAAVVETDPDGLQSSHLIRMFINEGLRRRAAKDALDAKRTKG
jgi:hypothetical protein